MTRVIAAVIRRHETFLVCQRPPNKRHGLLWEFPGGKIELNETDLTAARREMQEELGVSVTTVGPVIFSSHDPGSDFVIDFVPVHIEGEPRCLEHSALAWVNRSELHTYELAPSDLKFVRYLQSRAAENE